MIHLNKVGKRKRDRINYKLKILSDRKLNKRICKKLAMNKKMKRKIVSINCRVLS